MERPTPPKNDSRTKYLVDKIVNEDSDHRLRAYLKSYDRSFHKSVMKMPIFNDRLNGRTDVDRNEMLCTLYREAPILILGRSDSPFCEMGLGEYFPTERSILDSNQRYNTCAVVGSSDTMKNCLLGKEIDAHDAVLRFNFAPTFGFEEDVGIKTTIRLINNHFFEEETNYTLLEDFVRQSTTTFFWKGGTYNLGNLYQWYLNSKPFFSGYVDWSQSHPDDPVYMINQMSLWQSWTVLQEFSSVQIMLQLCDEIDIYGMVPPDKSGQYYCHYFDDADCHFETSYHSFSAEYSFLKRLHVGTDEDITKGKATIQGYSTLTKCQNETD
ncbi:beta-galactoside alpha-2,6-sialyltransferase 1-like [Glandiceps talaboti]